MVAHAGQCGEAMVTLRVPLSRLVPARLERDEDGCLVAHGGADAPNVIVAIIPIEGKVGARTVPMVETIDEVDPQDAPGDLPGEAVATDAAPAGDIEADLASPAVMRRLAIWLPLLIAPAFLWCLAWGDVTGIGLLGAAAALSTCVAPAWTEQGRRAGIVAGPQGTASQ